TSSANGESGARKLDRDVPILAAHSICEHSYAHVEYSFLSLLGLHFHAHVASDSTEATIDRTRDLCSEQGGPKVHGRQICGHASDLFTSLGVENCHSHRDVASSSRRRVLKNNRNCPEAVLFLYEPTVEIDLKVRSH